MRTDRRQRRVPLHRPALRGARQEPVRPSSRSLSSISKQLYLTPPSPADCATTLSTSTRRHSSPFVTLSPSATSSSSRPPTRTRTSGSTASTSRTRTTPNAASSTASSSSRAASSGETCSSLSSVRPPLSAPRSLLSSSRAYSSSVARRASPRPHRGPARQGPDPPGPSAHPCRRLRRLGVPVLARPRDVQLAHPGDRQAARHGRRDAAGRSEVRARAHWRQGDRVERYLSEVRPPSRGPCASARLTPGSIAQVLHHEVQAAGVGRGPLPAPRSVPLPLLLVASVLLHILS